MRRRSRPRRASRPQAMRFHPDRARAGPGRAAAPDRRRTASAAARDPRPRGTRRRDRSAPPRAPARSAQTPARSPGPAARARSDSGAARVAHRPPRPARCRATRPCRCAAPAGAPRYRRHGERHRGPALGIGFWVEPMTLASERDSLARRPGGARRARAPRASRLPRRRRGAPRASNRSFRRRRGHAARPPGYQFGDGLRRQCAERRLWPDLEGERESLLGKRAHALLETHRSQHVLAPVVRSTDLVGSDEAAGQVRHQRHRGRAHLDPVERGAEAPDHGAHQRRVESVRYRDLMDPDPLGLGTVEHGPEIGERS